MTATRTDGANRGTYTYSDVPIGDPSPDRLVVFAYEGLGLLVNFTQNISTSVNGNAPDYVVGPVNGIVGVRQIAIASGTTATFVVSRAAGQLIGGALIVWVIYGLRSHTPVDIQSAGGVSNPSVSLTASPNSVAIGYGREATGTGAASFTWTGLTETADFAIGGTGSDDYQTAAIANRMTAGSHAIQCAISRSGSTTLYAASWR
jgi:hypothetical protein